MRLRLYPLIGLVLLLAAPLAFADITGGVGNDPLQDHGWPKGAVDVANLKSRIAWWEGPPFGGGEYHFDYRGDTEVFHEALKKFALVRTPKRELYVHAGAHQSFWLNPNRDPNAKVDASCDWTFTVWVPRNWHHLYNNPRSQFASDQPQFRQPVAAPRIDVWVGGRIDWSLVKVPDGITVIDERAAVAGLEPERGATVHGSVFDMATGKPIVGATVAVAGTDPAKAARVEGRVDEDGRFEINDIPEGTYTIAVSADGYAPRRVGYEQLDAMTLKTYDVYLSQSATVSGVVNDPEGKPLAGVTVRLNSPLAIDGRGYPAPDTQQTVTGEDGKFRFEHAATGFTSLWCSREGYYQPGSIGTLYDVPSENIAVSMVQTGDVRVVVDAGGRALQPDMHVSIVPEGGDRIGSWGGSAQVQADRTVTFKGVPPGRYTVMLGSSHAPTSGGLSGSADIEVKPGAPLEITITAKPAK